MKIMQKVNTEYTDIHPYTWYLKYLDMRYLQFTVAVPMVHVSPVTRMFQKYLMSFPQCQSRERYLHMYILFDRIL